MVQIPVRKNSEGRVEEKAGKARTSGAVNSNHGEGDQKYTPIGVDVFLNGLWIGR